MAVHAYDNYIHHYDHPLLKRSLQEIQQQHKLHAQIIAERIQNLGGIPVDNPGIIGTIVEWMKNLTEQTNEDTHMIKDAIAGEIRGIEVSQKILKGDLDSESKQLVEGIINHDKQHVHMLKELL